VAEKVTAESAIKAVQECASVIGPLIARYERLCLMAAFLEMLRERISEKDGSI
jgi:hypothetical protein